MEKTIKTFKYNNEVIEFNLLTSKTIMVNATEMAKPFGKLPYEFLKLPATKAYIKSCLATGLSRSSEEEIDTGDTGLSRISLVEKDVYEEIWEVQKEEDLYKVVHGVGTWMHQILAIKFAAWLNPDFEVWVFKTILKLLFGKLNNRTQLLKQKTFNDLEIARLEAEWRRSDAAQKIDALKADNIRLGKEAKRRDNEFVSEQMSIWFPENKN